MDRKSFIKKGLMGTGLLLASPLTTAFAQENTLFDAEEIREFVGAAHRDFEETKRIIEQKPLLLNCTNQGRKGDFETAMGGACHVGQPEIAELLIGKGARLDMFNLAFLGFDEHIMALVSRFPALLRAPGPHGFSLLHHAQVGGHEGLSQWLQGQGLTERQVPLQVE